MCKKIKQIKCISPYILSAFLLIDSSKTGDELSPYHSHYHYFFDCPYDLKVQEDFIRDYGLQLTRERLKHFKIARGPQSDIDTYKYQDWQSFALTSVKYWLRDKNVSKFYKHLYCFKNYWIILQATKEPSGGYQLNIYRAHIISSKRYRV